MRRMAAKTALILVLAVVLGAGAARAAMVGGLASPLNESEASLSLIMGYSERDVEDGIKDEARSKKFLFKGAYGLGHNAEIYALLGLSDIDYKDVNFSGNLGETFGFGLRYSPTEFADGTKLVLNLEGEFSASEDGTDKVKSQAYRASVYAVGKFGSSGKFGFFFPFAGLSISSVSYENDGYDDYENSGNIGLVAGTDFFVNPNIFFTLEFHIFDESAAYLSAGYRF